MRHDAPINRVVAALEARGCDPRPSGTGKYKAKCPAHEDRSPSLSVAEGDDGKALLKCHAGCKTEAILEAIDLAMKDLYVDRPELRSRPTSTGPKPASMKLPISGKGNGREHPSPEKALAWHVQKVKGRLSEQGPWIYNDRDGHEVMRVYRIDFLDRETGEMKKQCLPVHRDAAGWHVGDPPGYAKLPLYNLDALASADVVYVTEGEKCAKLVLGLGLDATTSSHGSSSAAKTDWSPLAGKTVIIIPDHGQSGEGYAAAVAKILTELDPAPMVHVVRLPLERDGDDIEQWLDQAPDTWGPEKCREELERLAAEAPEWRPTACPIIPIDEESEEDEVRDPIGDPDPKAFDGILGRLALETQSQTEANALFVQMHLLAFFGATLGRGPHFVISATRHYLNLFVGLIGISGWSRKGTAGDVAKAIWRQVEPSFVDDGIIDGLNSGAGLLQQLRDASMRQHKSGPIADEGVSDKRRVFLEEEFGAVFKQGHRENETLLDLLRKFFDGKEVIRSNTKDPTKVTGGHVSVIGHCTPADLEINLSDADKSNGTANRFLWLFGVRSKIQPDGGDVFDLLSNFLGARLQELREVIEFARGVGEMRRDREAQERWKEIYRDFCNVPPGRLGVFFVRAAPMVMRLASLFALASRSQVVQRTHLEAALAIWEHSARSLRFVFQSDVDPRAEKLLAALRVAPEGLTKSQIVHQVFSGNLETSILNDLLTRLLAYRQILKIEPVASGRGRPPSRFAIHRW